MIQFSKNISLSLISLTRNFSSRKISCSIIISLFALQFSLFTSCKTTESTTKVENQPEAKVNGVVGQDPKATELENTFLEAKKQEIIGDAQKALSLYEACLKIQPENDAVNFQMANILYQTQKYTEALAHIKISVKQSPTNKYYEQLYAEILNRSGNPKAAGEVYGTLSKQSPNNVDYLFNYAYFLSLSGQIQQAIDQYNKIEQQVGAQEDLAMEKQRLYNKMGKENLGIAEIQKLSDANPTEPRFLAMLADMYTQAGQNDKVIEVVKKLAEVDPKNATAQLALSDYYRRAGDNEKYFEAMKKVFASPTMDIDNKIKVMLSYLSYLKVEPRKNEALQLGAILIATHPTEAKAFAMYADVLNQLEQNENALMQYQAALKLDNSKFTIWQQVLYLESAMKLKDSLANDALRCTELFPAQGLPFYMLGAAKLQSKKYDDAVTAISQAIVIGSDDKKLMAELYSTIAEAYNGLKKYSASDSCYELSLSLDNENYFAMNNYAYYLSLRGEKLDRAEVVIQKAIKLLPNNAGNLDTYAWVLYKAKKYQEAKTQIEKALLNGGDKNGTILEHYGDILFQLGETDKAIENWLKAKEFHAESEWLDKKINDKKLYE